ncbi:sensor histidine kinase [Paenibacillus sp. GCM10027628]|uniref:sensor histidine kinase n=1 Tax=Paenibacillus sp. GCM10027628 TaxID=3273413 RepID=UPI00362B2A45
MKWIDKTNNIRMKKKLIISFILVVFIPVGIVGALLTQSLRQTALNDAVQQTSNDVEKVKTRIGEILKMSIEISNKLSTDPRLEALVNKRYESNYSVVEAYREYREFEQYVRLYKEIANIRLYVDNPTLLNNWDYLQPEPSIANSEWYKATIKNSAKIGWYYIGDETKGDNAYLSLVRRVYFPNYRTTGVLVIDISRTELNGVLRQEQFDTMVIDGDGYIDAAKNTGLVGKRIRDFHITQEMLDKPSGTYQIDYNGETSKLIIESLIPDVSSNGLKIISVFSVQSIVKGANRISMFALSIIIMSLLIALVFIYIFSSLLSKRILRLSKQINKVALGDLHASSVIDGDDEIGQLSRQFNNMVGNIRELMEEVTESNRQKAQLELKQKEIKLKMMASQINPHFLFNALESLRMKIHLRGSADIADIVRVLGKLMRKSLEIRGGTITLGEELDMVRCYLAIQQFRYEDRLSYEIELDPASTEIQILPLIVQPLVENAVIHGIENKEEAGFVRIRTELQDDALYVTVADDGAGIPETRLNALISSLDDPEDGKNHRIGLRNVHQRLILTYGEQSGLRIVSRENEGTEIRFMIPIGGDSHV